MAKYVIDYGHCLNGADTGAGANGYREEILTREIGRLVVQKLKVLGHDVYEIDLQSANSLRESLNYRINKINSINPDLSISIHINAGGGRGTEILTDGYNSDVANRILSKFVTLGYKNRGIKSGADLAVVGGVKPYAMLVECCFIDTDDMNKYNADKFSTAIVEGITGQVVNSNTNNEKEEEKKVEKIIVYYGDADLGAALSLQRALKCPIFPAYYPFDYECVKTIYAVGGQKSNYTYKLTDENFISGRNSEETVLKVAEFIKNLK